MEKQVEKEATARAPVRPVQHTLSSFLGLSESGTSPTPASTTGFLCEKPSCAMFGTSFARKTELTNHLRSKQHLHPSVKRPVAVTATAAEPAVKKPRQQFRLAFKRRVVDAFEALVEDREDATTASHFVPLLNYSTITFTLTMRFGSVRRKKTCRRPVVSAKPEELYRLGNLWGRRPPGWYWGGVVGARTPFLERSPRGSLAL
eukprot:GHVU01070585.1.p1 GENE.GHVU01070585.1~~GHVU01070585.1.p1  ORF type:complete len:203 (+),score=8.55 GHVU01070585.1:349-957(+)